MSLPAERPLVWRSRPARARRSLAGAGPCSKRAPSRRAIGLLRASSLRTMTKLRPVGPLARADGKTQRGVLLSGQGLRGRPNSLFCVNLSEACWWSVF